MAWDEDAPSVEQLRQLRVGGPAHLCLERLRQFRWPPPRAHELSTVFRAQPLLVARASLLPALLTTSHASYLLHGGTAPSMTVHDLP